MRAPELSAGHFSDLVSTQLEQTAADILLSMSSNLTTDDPRRILIDFAEVRTHLAFYVCIKLIHFEESPWRLFQTAHHANDISHGASQNCVSHPVASHPRLRALQKPPMNSQCERYLATWSLRDLRELQFFIGQLEMIESPVF